MEIGKYTLDELHRMLDSAKKQKAAQPLIPLINIAIDAEEQRIRNEARDAALRAMRPQHKIQEIIVRATNIDSRARDRYCKGSFHQEGDHFVFEMQETKNWFRHKRFLPRSGFLLMPNDCQREFVITDISYLGKRPKRAIFTAVPSDAD